MAWRGACRRERAAGKPRRERLRGLAQGVATVVSRLEAREAVTACGQAAATLLQAMKKPTNRDSLGELAAGLAAVAGRLEPREVNEAATILTRAMSKTTDSIML